MANLGKRNLLPVLRQAPPGLFLDGGSLGEILLPNCYIPGPVTLGMEVDVFVHLDSEDRLVATTETPRVMVGEFAALRVVSVEPRLGAFLDWGLSKDLFLPLREQTHRAEPGQNVVVHVSVDERSGRIVATTRLTRHLQREPARYREGTPVQVLLVARTPLGLTAIVEQAHLGLLYHDPHAPPLEVGQSLTAHVAAVRPDGKIDLRLEPSAARGVLGLTERILTALDDGGGRLALDDSSTPEEIQERFGVSKKSFKQAVGALYRDRQIQLPKTGGIERVPKKSGRSK